MGGYTGMQPSDFRTFAETIAADAHLPKEKLILGGDHLGPNPWRHLPAAEAMQHAKAMVSAYARASFSKIHLDASMSCLGDPTTLSDTEVASRSVQLCLAAEAAYPAGQQQAGLCHRHRSAHTRRSHTFARRSRNHSPPRLRPTLWLSTAKPSKQTA